MKKIIISAISIALTSIFICGCANSDTQENTSKILNANLNKLYSVVNNLDTIDNNYINNPDIYSVQKTINMSKNNEKISVFNNNFSKTIKQINDENTNISLDNILKNEIQERLSLNNNGYCNNCNNTFSCDENGFCNNCNQGILCDENGNCCYCENKLCLNNENTCDSCNKSYLIEKTQSTSYKPQHINIDSTIENKTLNENPVDYEFIDDTTFDKNYEIIPIEDNPTDENTTSITDTVKDESNEESNNETLADNEKSTTDKIKMYYFTTDSFRPLKLRYNPRFVSEYNESNINDQLSNYLYKVQRLYAMTEDALEANNVLRITKVELLDTIDEVRDLNNCIINGECAPTVQQLQAINNYIQDIKTTIKRLKNCNGDLENEITTINSNVPTSIASSVDVMNSNYMKLINHLDTRITYHESAIATLEQIRYLLEDALNKSDVSDQEIEQIIEELNNNNVYESTPNDIVDNNTIDIQDNTTDNNLNEDDNTVNDSETDIDIAQKADSNNQYTDNSVNTNNELLDRIENEEIEIVVIDPTHFDSTTESIEEDSLANQDVKNENEYSTTENENIDNDLENKEKNTIKNIDTYRPSNDDSSDNITEENNSENIVNENAENNIDTNSTINDIPNPAFDNTNPVPSNTNNNAFSNSIANDENTINGTAGGNIINDNIYKNSVINQNNLNNNDGYGGYYYTNDGEIKNNGTNNNAEYGNNGNTIQNNMNRNNNTNTYGYNTMLDIINQGTVNNGINTL